MLGRFGVRPLAPSSLLVHFWRPPLPASKKWEVQFRTCTVLHLKKHLFSAYEPYAMVKRKASTASKGGRKQKKSNDADLVDIEDTPEVTVMAGSTHSASYHRLQDDEVEMVRRELVLWYRKNRRKLPWRGDPPPYGAAEKSESKKRKASAPLKGFLKQGGEEESAGVKSEEGDQLPVTGSVKNANGGVKIAVADGTSVSTSVSSSPSPDKDYSVSPYGTWVSEIMCQQTRVETVIDYWTRWMEKFPTVASLAEASIDDVNKAWEGLGYYSRGRRLREGAMYVMEHCGGNIPDTREELLKLPGIGPYTAGAISSIAFNEQSPLVDGNVIRVMSRLRAVACDAADRNANKLYWELAQEWVDKDHPGDFNQAVMELGATVCTPKNPQCGECPLSSICAAYREVEEKVRPHNGHRFDPSADTGCDMCSPLQSGESTPSSVMEYPQAKKRKAPRPETVAVAVISRPTSETKTAKSGSSSEFLIVKRPDDGLLAGQWELPSVIIPCDTDETVVFQSLQTLLSDEVSTLIS